MARFDGAERFFSFTCGGKPSAELLGGWELKRSTRELDPQRVEHTLTYSDPGTGLAVRCLAIRPYLFGDFYPLMPYNLEQDTWIAWQFDVPEQGEGMVQAFRRGQSNHEITWFKLRGLKGDTRYVLTNLDTGESQTLAGRELLDKGLAVQITEQPGSAVIKYTEAR